MNQHYVPLRTSAIVEQTGSDRPSFDARRSRTFGGSRYYRVFCFTDAMLFLTINQQVSQDGPQVNGGVVVGAVVGGAIGALIGSMAAQSGPESSQTSLRENYNLYTDEQILTLASQRKHCFIAEYSDIESARIDGPSFLDRMFFGSKVVGYISISDRARGKFVLEITSSPDMLVAIQALTKWLGDAVQVNLEWREDRRAFVAK